jgi:hypothetical protein
MSKQHSAIVKGIAILLMLVCHFPFLCGYETLGHSVASFLASISHPIQYFMVVSGYGLYYAYSQDRLSWPYLLKRTGRLYISFWLVLAIFVFGLGYCLLGEFHYDQALTHFTNIIGWRWDYCQFTWFLLTYVLLTFCSKWIFRGIERTGNLWAVIITFVVSIAMQWVISRYYLTYLRYHYFAYHPILVIQQSFSFTVGAVMARLTLSGKEITWNWLKGKNLVVVLFIAIAFALRGLTFVSIIPFFPIIIIWLVLHINPGAVSRYVFIPLGDKSMMMWFAHGFIGPVLFKDYYLVFKWPALIWLAWVIISFAVSCLLIPVSNRISKTLKLY